MGEQPYCPVPEIAPPKTVVMYFCPKDEADRRPTAKSNKTTPIPPRTPTLQNSSDHSTPTSIFHRRELCPGLGGTRRSRRWFHAYVLELYPTLRYAPYLTSLVFTLCRQLQNAIMIGLYTAVENGEPVKNRRTRPEEKESHPVGCYWKTPLQSEQRPKKPSVNR